MATAFYGGNFFGGEFFSSSGGPGPGPEPEPEVVSGGKGDNEARKRFRQPPIKPTGLPTLHVRKSKIPGVQMRLEDAAAIHAEVSQRVAREFTEEIAPVAQMSQADIEREIGILLRSQIAEQQKDDEEIMFLLLLAAKASR